jgi:hypothetical protein
VGGSTREEIVILFMVVLESNLSFTLRRDEEIYEYEDHD